MTGEQGKLDFETDAILDDEEEEEILTETDESEEFDEEECLVQEKSVKKSVFIDEEVISLGKEWEFVNNFCNRLKNLIWKKKMLKKTSCLKKK